jgi:signal peptidase II
MIHVLSVLAVAALTALDQITKYIATQKLKGKPSAIAVKNVLNFTYVENRGAAFGILQGARAFFAVLAILVLGAIIYYYITLPRRSPYGQIRASLIFVSAGTIGNLINRVLDGYVVDFLDPVVIKFMNFPVFNAADIYLTIGAIWLIAIAAIGPKNELSFR